MKLKLIEVPNILLKQKSTKIEKVDNELRELIDDMIEIMYQNNGVGLSAIQVSKPLRVVTVDLREENDNKNPMIFLNPEIIWFSDQKEIADEGCLSVPQQYAKISRSLSIKVKYNDINMNEKIIEASGLLARCLQHEVDHTNGIVFLDYLSNLKKGVILKKLEKSRKKSES